MTTKISLDTAALSSLIEKDPEFELELQSAVIANIAKRFVKSVGVNIHNAVQAAVQIEKDNIAKEYGSYSGGWNTKFTLNKTINDEISQAVKDAANKEIRSLIEKASVDALEYQKNFIAESIKKSLNAYTDKAIAAEVQAKVTAALSQIKF